MPWKQRGPLSLSGAMQAPQVRLAGVAACFAAADAPPAQARGADFSVQLRVLDPSKRGSSDAELRELHGAAGIAAADPSFADWDFDAAAPLYLSLASGSDCVLLAKPVAGVPRLTAPSTAARLTPQRLAGLPVGCLQLDDAQRHNLHAEHNERYTFKLVEPTASDALAEVELEARLMRPTPGAEAVRLDARAVVRALKQRCTGHMLAAGEVVLLKVAGHELRLRVAQTDTADASAREELVAYHCFRGVLAPGTDVYLHAMQDREDGGLGSLSLGGGLELLDCPLRPPSVPSANRVTVTCSDDEFFLVHKQVLRPCIALTAAIRAAGPAGGSDVQIDVSCLVFDRVLLFLEAEAQARPPPDFGINLLDELLVAARKLGLRSLEDYCATRLGEFSSRLREYSFAEVKARNAAGECLIIVDGMVLDVTRWLPEHPGGSTIIPTQALNMEAARFYELCVPWITRPAIAC